MRDRAVPVNCATWRSWSPTVGAARCDVSWSSVVAWRRCVQGNRRIVDDTDVDSDDVDCDVAHYQPAAAAAAGARKTQKQ